MNLGRLVTIVGRGILAGLGLGASAYGLLFLVLSFQQGEALNIGALVAIFAGCTCLAMSLTLNKNKSA